MTKRIGCPGKNVINGNTIYSVYNATSELLHRFDATGNQKTDYLKLGSKVVAEITLSGSTDTLCYPYFDHLGTAVKTEQSNGALDNAEAAIYMSFHPKNVTFY
jgi:hypothetical protein